MSRWGGVPPERSPMEQFVLDYACWLDKNLMSALESSTTDKLTMDNFVFGEAPKKTFREQLEEEFKNIGWHW